MSGRWLETVLVSDVVDAVGLAIITDVGVRATDGDRVGLSVRQTLQLGGLFGALLVGLAVPAEVKKKTSLCYFSLPFFIVPEHFPHIICSLSLHSLRVNFT